MADIDEGAVRDLLAREQIRQLPVRYASALDARDIDAMAELFAAQARFGDHGVGPDGARSLMADSMRDSVFAVILVANHLIEMDDETTAHGQVWAHCHAQSAEGFVEQLIRYDDRYVLEDGRWLFLHRRHRLWFGVAHDVSPLDQAPAEWPARQTGVGDLPLADPLFAGWWEDRRRERPSPH